MEGLNTFDLTSALGTIIPGVLLISDKMMVGLKPSNSCLHELKFWIYVVEINVLICEKDSTGVNDGNLLFECMTSQLAFRRSKSSIFKK
jgi:hypothetical protein